LPQLWVLLGSSS